MRYIYLTAVLLIPNALNAVSEPSPVQITTDPSVSGLTSLHIAFHPSVIENNLYTITSNEMALQSQVEVAQNSYLHNSTTNINNLLGNARDTAQEYTYGLFSWIAHNKKKSILYCLLTGYSYVLYKILRLNYTLSSATNWSQWQRTLSLEQLLAQSQGQIATNLLTDIQRQYTTPEKLDDFIGPLVAFVQDIDTELEQLRQLDSLHKWIGRLHVAFIFPKQTELLEHAQESIHRLTYLKNVLLNWVSENKVAKATQPG